MKSMNVNYLHEISFLFGDLCVKPLLNLSFFLSRDGGNHAV